MDNEITSLSHDELKETYYLLEKLGIEFSDLQAIYSKVNDKYNVELFGCLASECEHIRTYLDGSMFEGEDE